MVRKVVDIVMDLSVPERVATLLSDSGKVVDHTRLGAGTPFRLLHEGHSMIIAFERLVNLRRLGILVSSHD